MTIPERLSTTACLAAVELDNIRLGRPSGVARLRAVGHWLLEHFPDGTVSILDTPGIGVGVLGPVLRVLEAATPGETLVELKDVVRVCRQRAAWLLGLAEAGLYDRGAVTFCLALAREFSLRR